MVQKTLEMCNEVKSLGAALLQAMEKKDAEDMALLRSKNGIAVLKAVARQTTAGGRGQSQSGSAAAAAGHDPGQDQLLSGAHHRRLEQLGVHSTGLGRTAIEGEGSAVQIEYLETCWD